MKGLHIDCRILMKLTVSQKIVLGLVVILVLSLLFLWAALGKPLEHKKVFASEIAAQPAGSTRLISLE